MYYEVKEINNALLKAKSIIDSRTEEVKKYTLNYNDCWALIKEYDKALRGGTSLLNINFDYSDHKDFFKKLEFDLNSLAINAGYEIVKSKRPQFGDIAYEVLYGDGSAMIAGDGWWVTTSEKNLGTLNKRKRYHFERRLLLLARPLRS